ncbi:MAG: hypothetical protein ACFFFH_19995 [Candidatus Thorarchaeota archaeon]
MKNRQYIELISLILMTIVATSFISTILAVSQAKTLYIESTSPTIIAFGNDEAIQTAVREIKNDIPNTRIKEINDYSSLKKTFPRYAKYIFYVGHGEEAGLLVGTSLISWDDINALVHNFNGVHQFFVACHSDSIAATRRTTFSGKIDAIIAAKISVTWIKIYDTPKITLENALSIVEMVNEIVMREYALSNGEISVISLATESGHDLAFKRQYYKDTWFGITTREEMVLYLNMAPWIVNSLIALGMTFVGVVAGELASAIYAASLCLTCGLWALILTAFIIIAMVSLLWNMDRRGNHDAKVGYGCQYWPVPTPYIRFDNTYKKRGGDVIYPISDPTLILYCYPVALALSFIPNNVWYGVSLP